MLCQIPNHNILGHVFYPPTTASHILRPRARLARLARKRDGSEIPFCESRTSRFSRQSRSAIGREPQLWVSQSRGSRGGDDQSTKRLATRRRFWLGMPQNRVAIGVLRRESSPVSLKREPDDDGRLFISPTTHIVITSEFRTQNFFAYGVFAHRNPVPRPRNDGKWMSRSVERRFFSPLPQEPPRITLCPPVGGPVGFCAGLAL